MSSTNSTTVQNADTVCQTYIRNCLHRPKNSEFYERFGCQLSVAIEAGTIYQFEKKQSLAEPGLHEGKRLMSLGWAYNIIQSIVFNEKATVKNNT